MAKFLFTVWPFPGHVHPNVAVAHALSDGGHETAFYTGSSVRAFLETEGFRCFPFRQVEEARVDSIVLTLDALSIQWWKPRRRKALLMEWLLTTVEGQVQDVGAVVSAWRPDVIVCDPAMWGPFLVVQETARIPLAILSYTAACMLTGTEGPIHGLPLPQPHGRIGRFGRSLLRSLANVVAADVRRRADEIRASHGLPPMRTTVTAYAGRVPLYLVPSVPAFDRERRDLPPSVRYVGPCPWDKPRGASPAPWVSDLGRERPVVYVTEGTLHSKPPLLLRAALEGLASIPVQVIATTGNHRDPQSLELGAIPPNARVERWVPHSDLLPRTDVVITTGGTGTVLASLSKGVPLLVVPTAWDQPENAWRVAESGAGIRLPPRQCTPERIRASVGRLLNDGSFRRNALRLATEFSRYGGPAQAANLLEDLASRRDDPWRRDWTPLSESLPDGSVHERPEPPAPRPAAGGGLG